jgi:hypothetical protein
VKHGKKQLRTVLVISLLLLTFSLLSVWVLTRDSGPAQRDAAIPPHVPRAYAPPPELQESKEQVPLESIEAAEPDAEVAEQNESGQTEGFGHTRRVSRREDSSTRNENPALRWLLDHQSADGHWRAAWFADDTRRLGQPRTGNRLAGHEHDAGAPEYDLMVTALAVCAFTEYGFDHTDGPYSKEIKAALDWIVAQQVRSGKLALGPESMRTHAIATYALANAYGLSMDENLIDPTLAALGCLISAQRQNSGWGEASESAPDLLTTAYAVLALIQASVSGIPNDFGLDGRLPEQVAQGVAAFLAEIGGDGTEFARFSTMEASTRLLSPATAGVTLDALWLVCNRFAMPGGQYGVPGSRVRAERVFSEAYKPVWAPGEMNYLHFWFGGIAAFHEEHERAEAWLAQMSRSLLDQQRGISETDAVETFIERGSWDAVDAMSANGGRVYSTVLAHLALAAFKRWQILNR